MKETRCERRENPRVDEPGKRLSDNVSNLRTSDCETGDASFKFGHLIEPVLLRISTRAKPDCSSLLKTPPALLGVNVNAAARIEAVARFAATLPPRPCEASTAQFIMNS